MQEKIQEICTSLSEPITMLSAEIVMLEKAVSEVMFLAGEAERRCDRVLKYKNIVFQKLEEIKKLESEVTPK